MDAIPAPFSTRLAPGLTYTARVAEIAAANVDVVGDVHGCADELRALLDQAGYRIGPSCPDSLAPIALTHPDGRRLVFLGDLTDRGPDSLDVLRLAMGAVATGTGEVVMGNHDWKLLRALVGRKVEMSTRARYTVDAVLACGAPFPSRVATFLAGRPSQVRVLAGPEHPRTGDGMLTLVHAAAKSHRQDATDRESFERGIYGYPEGEQDGFLVRADWAAAYAGPRAVLHGHTPRKTATWVNRVLCLDTGCVFGGALSMYRVDADALLAEPARADHDGRGRVLV